MARVVCLGGTLRAALAIRHSTFLGKFISGSLVLKSSTLDSWTRNTVAHKSKILLRSSGGFVGNTRYLNFF